MAKKKKKKHVKKAKKYPYAQADKMYEEWEAYDDMVFEQMFKEWEEEKGEDE